MIRTAIERGTTITCHDTLPYGEHPEVQPAVCRGFFDTVGERTAAIAVWNRLLRLCGGQYVQVPPPQADAEST